MQYYFQHNTFSPIKTPILLFVSTEKVVVETLISSTNANSKTSKIKIKFDQIVIQFEIGIHT
jgi:hypothetical protein